MAETQTEATRPPDERLVQSRVTPDPDIPLWCLDEPTFGGMCHEYEVRSPDALMAKVSFQNGPVKEHGLNGCQNEHMLMMVADRLRGAQRGLFNCRQNEQALAHIEEALLWLHARRHDRRSRQVEGMFTP